MQVAAIIIVSLCVLTLLALIGASLFFYNVTFARPKAQASVDEHPAMKVDPEAELATFDERWLLDKPFEKAEMKSYDGLTLRAHYLPARTPTCKTVILAHGYTSRGLPDMGMFAEVYHDDLNFNVLLPDDRGHGESEGSYIGMGWHDRLDFVKWIYWVIQKVGEDAEIVLHGISMGGATVLMTSGERLPDQVKCIISDCAYTSIKDILVFQIKQMYKLPPFPMIPLTSLVCKLRAGYFFGEGSAIKQLCKNTRPVLFIHGAVDDFVPTAMVHPLYDACQAPKEKVLIERAGHGMALATDKAGYTQAVRSFTNTFIR